MALALNELFALHKMAKDSHDEAVAALQHLGSLRKEKNHIQTSFNEVNAERQQSISRRNDLQEQLSKLIQVEIKAINLAIGTLESTIKAQDSSRSSLFWHDIHLDNKIRELGNQHVAWELDQKVGSERLAQLENEWTACKNRLDQATPTLPASFFEVVSEGTYSSVMTTPFPVDPVAQLSADILIDLQSETIASSVTQEVLSEFEQQPDDTLAVGTQAFTETPSVVVDEPLLDAERRVPEEVGSDERNSNLQQWVPQLLQKALGWSFVNVDDDEDEVVPHRVDEQPKVFESNTDSKFPFVDELIEKSEGVKKITKLQRKRDIVEIVESIKKFIKSINKIVSLGLISELLRSWWRVKTEPRAKEAPPTKEIPVSSEGMIPIDQLKKFIEGTIKNNPSGPLILYPSMTTTRELCQNSTLIVELTTEVRCIYTFFTPSMRDYKLQTRSNEDLVGPQPNWLEKEVTGPKDLSRLTSVADERRKKEKLS
ncbi:hypothetical protein RND71_034580 [Anisodus tanguticus]|uniref:Uncharacterized protein n=1 Tax=Anisodus tanguticus TaxID=243964 RepID=A0AAE1RAG8_9SOLA|nr:hypothetical protein RND71_034580 [Anisodus tanguticus]